MFDRYKDRLTLLNDQEMYKDYLKKRNLKLINQYNTPTFKFPETSDLSKFNMFEHIWTTGDKYYKLADKYYGDPKLWWIIAKFNSKPTESHVKIGEVLLIPTPASKILNYLTG